MLATARFTPRGLSAVVAALLVLLLGAAAVGIFALRSIAHPVPAHPSQSAAARYSALLQRDHELLNQAIGHEVVVGYQGTYCDTLAQTECPVVLGRAVGAYQRLLDDLDRTTPPAQFATEHARLRADVAAVIEDLNLGASAFNAGDISASNRALIAGLDVRDEILLTEAFVAYEAGGANPASGAADADYSAMVGRDYDSLHLPALVSALLTCKVGDSRCAASVASTRSATHTFLADLQARTPPTRFLALQGLLAAGLAGELQSLDAVDAAYASGDQTSFDLAMQGVMRDQGRLSIYAVGILYAH